MNKTMKRLLLLFIILVALSAALFGGVKMMKAYQLRQQAEQLKLENREKYPLVYQHLEEFLAEKYPNDTFSVEHIAPVPGIDGLYDAKVSAKLVGVFTIRTSETRVNNDPYFDLYLSKQIEGIVLPLSRSIIGDTHSVTCEALLMSQDEYTSFSQLPSLNELLENGNYKLYLDLELWKSEDKGRLTAGEATTLSDFANALLDADLKNTQMHVKFGRKYGKSGFTYSSTEDIDFSVSLIGADEFTEEMMYALTIR